MSARGTGWDIKPSLRDTQDEPAEDTPERRAEYIGDHKEDLVEWLRLGYPEILDEFIEHYWWDYKD